MTIRIEKHLVSEMSPDLKQELKRRVDREFADVSIVREHVWAEPWLAISGSAEGQLVSFLNLVDRQVLTDDTATHFFGLNNVITEPEYRGKGFSTALNRYAIQVMQETDPQACGFLFCADALIPFYARLGWQKFDGTVTVSQPSGDKLWPSNAMYFDLSGTRHWKTVHLRGLPW